MKILQICHKPAYPPIDGASIAMYNLYNGLSNNGHQVHVLAINTYKQYCNIKTVPLNFITESNYTLVDVDIRVRAIPAFLNLFTDKSYNIVRFGSVALRDAIEKLIENNTYDTVILESLYATVHIDLLRQKTNAKIVLRSHNAEFKIWENLYNNEKNTLKKWYLNILSKRLKKYEKETLKKVDLIAAISRDDNVVFKSEGCLTPMEYTPFGINFNDEEFKEYVSPEKEDLVFFHVGSMDWIPHQEAFRWFLEKVWTPLNIKYPRAKLHLAGSKMPEWITRGKFPNVIVTSGYVEGKTFMNKKCIMVVPSFSGSGIRIKIAEGMAKGKVVVTTKNGAMGIPCTHNENIFISDSADEWISILSRCMQDLELVKQISKNARAFSKREFDYNLAANKLIEAVKNLY
ncbi:MAG: glycosyltransferase family 4 protein [Bacteroidia bacterium]|nr:glycosyltransferase family 4 protein [Bacteroidia bacterium]